MKNRSHYLALVCAALLFAAACSPSTDSTTDTDEGTESSGSDTTVAATGDGGDESDETSPEDDTDTGTDSDDAESTDTTEAAAESPSGGGGECLVGQWEASTEDARQWAESFGANLIGTNPLAALATLVIDAAQFGAEFRDDGTATNTASFSGSVSHPQGDGAATISSTIDYTWTADGSTLTMTITGGGTNGELEIEGLAIPMGSPLPAAALGGSNTVEFLCDGDTLQAEFGVEQLATQTPVMTRVG